MNKTRKVDVTLDEDRVNKLTKQAQQQVRTAYSTMLSGRSTSKSDKNLLRKYIVVSEKSQIKEGGNNG